jgi:phospholipid/cholesterol/gamma-HCH transport system substrate-binding protein
MRRVLTTLGVVPIVALLVVLTASSSNSGGYVLRAVFDNGSGLRTGMDVRVSGIDVGRVTGITLDQSVPERPRAVAIVRITDPAAQGFRRDGSCAIRSATLLGDRFVDCTLMKKRSTARPLAEKDGRHLMPVTQTSSPVDPDLMLDIFRLPVRQRLSILINELGTGLAGNGTALRQTIRRADPALLQLDKTLAILRTQRRALGALADSSDRVLAPLSHERERLAGFVVHGRKVFEAVAQRRVALQASFRRLPGFLARLRPALRDLQGLAGQAGPVLADLDSAGTRLSRATQSLAPAARAGTRGLRALGGSAAAQAHGLEDARPVFGQLARLQPASAPVWDDLNASLASLRQGGGLERLVELPMAVGLTTNGYDKYGFYQRANAVITICTSYAVERTAGCVGTFPQSGAKAASIPSSDTQLLDFLFGGDK